jgi:LDH2 family malate/lactate/ureidoglycolate dehydrogenase
MNNEPTLTIPVATLRNFLVEIFKAAGCDQNTADLCAEGVVDADLHGHHIQGTDHIYSTIANLRSNRLNGRPKPRITHETTATARIDGDGGPGHVTGLTAANLAIEKAKQHGVGAVALVGGGDIFRLGYYVERMARAGMIGMVMTNTHPMRVHVPGGIEPIMGTNPVAFAFPCSGSDPIVVDMATSTSAIGHVRLASYSNSPIPAGIAIDRNGAPTTDPHEALEGALTPLGGHKGFGIGLAIGLLSSTVIGAAIGERLRAAVAADNGERSRGHIFIAIDPRAFGAGDQAERTAEYVAELKNSRKAQPTNAILMPGERGQQRKQAYVHDGIPLPVSVWENTKKIARDLGVSPPKLDSKA